MTSIGLIVAILALVGSGPSKKIIAVCIIIALIGLLTVIYQVRRLYRFEKSRLAISDLLAEGQQRVLAITSSQPTRNISNYPSLTWDDSDAYELMESWCKQVERVLQTLGESYVTRFHLGGSNEQDAKSMTVWKMNHRLETLASFLRELK
jgi:hypothetical protein